MATFVLVHGGFGGGWEWTPVARRLRSLGHEAFTPTLTGMGERAHLATPGIGVSVHVEDILGVLELEALHGVVLCGHSYGGMPVTGVADRAPDRIGSIVYIDALVPEDGQSAFDLLPDWFADDAHATADEHGGVPMPDIFEPPSGSVDEDARQRYVERLRPQPLESFAEPVHLTGAGARLPRAFVRCTREPPPGDPIAAVADRARALGWTYRELAAPHDPQLVDPGGTASVLHELAAVLAGPR